MFAGEQQQGGAGEGEPQKPAAKEEGVQRVVQQHARQPRGQGGEGEQQPLPQPQAQELGQVRRHDGGKRARVQHDAEKHIRPARIRAQKPLEQQQMPAGRNGQKFAGALHDAQDRRLPDLHTSPLPVLF